MRGFSCGCFVAADKRAKNKLHMQPANAMMMMTSIRLPGLSPSSSLSSSTIRLLGCLCCFLLVINGIEPAATTTVTSTITNATKVTLSGSTTAADAAANIHDGSIGMADNDIGHGNGERILSRKRRYLIFPQGSSMQLGEFRCSADDCVCLRYFVADPVSVASVLSYVECDRNNLCGN